MEKKTLPENRNSFLKNKRNSQKIQDPGQEKVSQHALSSKASLEEMGYYFHRDGVKKFQKYLRMGPEEVYRKVYKFCLQLIHNQSYREQILKYVRHETRNEEKNISLGLVDSFKMTQSPIVSGKICQKNDKKGSMKNQLCLNISQFNGRNQDKKVSIFIEDQIDNQKKSEPFLSNEEVENWSDFELPSIKFSLQLLKELFDPEPFLINLSICLMVKFIFCSGVSLDVENINWILSVGGILGSKMYYDDIVEGLLGYYGFLLQIEEEQVGRIERYFLQKIEFKTMITMREYQGILEQIMMFE